MTTEYIHFNENMTVQETIEDLRNLRPEADSIYYLYVVDDYHRFIATVSLRDIIISQPDTKLKDIMNTKVLHVFDDDKIDCLAEIISKYSLLALPVVNRNMVMLGVVVIDDIVYDLLKSKRKRGR